MRCHLFIIVLSLTFILFVSPVPVAAGVKVVMTNEIGPDQNFLVITNISNHGLHGSFTDPLDRSFMTAGEVKNINVLMTKPLVYNKVYAQALHPAYYGAFASSEKKPSLLRSVRLELKNPRSWRALLSNDEPVREDGGSLNANYISDHFSMVIRYYLPAYDRQGIEEKIERYLPLFREMADFAHSDLAHQRYRETYSRYQTKQPDFEKNLAYSEGRVLGELDQRLKLIEALFSLDRGLRTRMHDWLKMFHKGEYVYTQIMNDEDRLQLQQFMEQNRERTRKSNLDWTNADNVGFRVRLNSRYANRKKGEGLHDACYSLSFTTDLNSVIDFRYPHYSKKSHANICRTRSGQWELK